MTDDKKRSEEEFSDEELEGVAGGLDLSGAAFKVLNQASQDADEDIRLTLEQIKANSEAKDNVRDQISQLNAWIADND